MTGTRTAQSLGRPFACLWAAYAVSTFGTWLAFDAFSLIAIIVLHAGPAQVSLLAAAGLAVGAAVAVPLGPWVEFRRKRPVMIAMDLTRFAALISIPAAFALGRLTFAQLLIVAVVVGSADIAFKAAGGACLKALVKPEHLLVANGRFESTMWTATALGPPLGGAMIGLLGPATTIVADAVSYLLSALGIRAIGGTEKPPERPDTPRLRAGDLLEGWRHILTSAALRPLFFNTVLVNGLIMATAPLVAVLMLGELGFAPWQYALAFGAPCVGGLVGSRLSRRMVARFGKDRVMLVAGSLRACWSIGLACVVAGTGGLALVIGVQLGLVTCVGVFNPVFATYRLEQTPGDRLARTLSAWSVTSSATIAVMTAIWGLLASVTSPRIAIAIAGLLLLTTPLLLPRAATRRRSSRPLQPAARPEPAP
ncbi:MAG TPA: MFS transporter [Thermoleophilaceae bacterium]|nr:MFS transporter [Thermoleophilaceae bacterium]